MYSREGNLCLRLDMLRRASAMLAFAMVCALPMAAFAAHPLATEDTGVQGQDNWQLELNSDRSVERDTRFTSLAVNATLTYGLTDALDAGLNVPWQRNQVGDEPREYERGEGDISVFMKWVLYQEGKLGFAVNPILYLPTGDSDKGLGTDRANPSVIAVTTWGDEALSLSANLGYTYNDNKVGDRRNIWLASAAAMVGLVDRLRGAVEIGAYTNADTTSHKSPAFVNVGLIYSPTDKLDFDLGYKRGLNDAECRHSFGAGITVRW